MYTLSPIMKNFLIKENYLDVKKMTERSKRTKALGIRKHHLSNQEMECIGKAWSEGVWVAPYRKGTRSCLLGALFELGINEAHSCEKVAERFGDIAAITNLKKGTVLDSFLKRQGVTPSGDSILGVARELQRVTGMHPYGMKLAQIGMQIDVVSLSGNPHLVLRDCVAGEKISPRNDFISPYKKNEFVILAESHPPYNGMKRWATVRDISDCDCAEN